MRKILLYCFYINLTWSAIYLIYRNWGHFNPEDLAYDSLKIIVNMFIIWLILKTNKPRKVLTKFEHFHNEAFKAETRKEYEKALQIRIEGLKLITLTDLQRADLHVGNGGTYLSLNDYINATSCFDKAFELTKQEKFPYDEQYKKIIECYIKANRKEDAIILVEDLLKRQSYNKKFKRLQPVKDKLLS
jgi:tetratricopeptide (TPR) repeat protein